MFDKLYIYVFTCVLFFRLLVPDPQKPDILNAYEKVCMILHDKYRDVYIIHKNRENRNIIILLMWINLCSDATFSTNVQFRGGQFILGRKTVNPNQFRLESNTPYIET